MILTGYLLLTCKFQQVVRRESKWAKGHMTLNTLHLRLRDIRVGKEGQKLQYSAADTLLLLSQVNPLAESVDTDDDNSKETQTSITGFMTDSMQLELQTLRT